MSRLLRTAILGTGQVAGSDDHTDTAADELVTRLGNLERERAILLRAGGAAVVERAARRARTLKGVPDRAPEETLALAPPKLAHMLQRLLQGEHHHLLPEALEGTTARGYRLPEELLPMALRESESELRALLLPVLGARGRWLSGKRSEWSWAASALAVSSALPADADERWAEGTTAERKSLLLAARRLVPERGRAWVESTFKADKPEIRATWLQALELGLTPDDVPFLESALADRSQTVRAAAARVLWRLPGSGTAKAMRERLEALLPVAAPSTSMWGKLKGVMSRGAPQLEVNLPPEEFDKALEKLGVIENPPWQQIGRRQWWLAQHVAAVDPGSFVERLQSTPEALVEAGMKHDLCLSLLNGWSSAAVRFDARAWFAPLWDAWMDSKEVRSWFNEDPLERLTAGLTPAELEPRLLRCLREQRRLDLLERLPRPWPDSIARAFVGVLRSGSGFLIDLMPLAASRVPLGLVPAGLKLPEESSASPSYVNAFEDFLSAIEFRRRLAQELSP